MDMLPDYEIKDNSEYPEVLQERNFAEELKADADKLNSLEFQRSQMKIAAGAIKFNGINCFSINNENLIMHGEINEKLIKFFLSEITRLDKEIENVMVHAIDIQAILAPVLNLKNYPQYPY